MNFTSIFGSSSPFLNSLISSLKTIRRRVRPSAFSARAAVTFASTKGYHKTLISEKLLQAYSRYALGILKALILPFFKISSMISFPFHKIKRGSVRPSVRAAVSGDS